MPTPRSWLALALAATLPVSCNKPEQSNAEPGTTDATAAETATPTPAVASHLGFAINVPADADLYISGHFMDEMTDALTKAFLVQKELTVDDDGTNEESDDLPLTEDTLREIARYTGDEFFLFVGPGTGDQLRLFGETYRTLSATFAGTLAGAVLDAISETDTPADFTRMAGNLPDDLANQWLDALEKNQRIQIPSVVFGWQPDASKLAECDEFIRNEFLTAINNEEIGKPVEIESCGTTLRGFEVAGDFLFEEVIEDARAELAKQGIADTLPPQISEQRIERFLSALEKLRITIAAGTADGRVITYIGNGQEGFKLAATPDQSLAAAASLRWTHQFAQNPLIAFTYLSEDMVDSALPWLDDSLYWNAIAGAIREPVTHQDNLRKLFTGLADTSRDIARRDTSALSILCVRDRGWRIESRGGWPDPDLDYQTPHSLASATDANSPAIRANWVQNRERNNARWSQLEHFAAIAEAMLEEVRANAPETAAMAPETITDRAITELRELNRAYRDEFRAGIGDEVAFVLDLDGEVPPVPGIPEETVAKFRAPRFTYARNVLDRTQLSAAGTSGVNSWRSLTAWATELSGEELPLIQPQSVESAGLVTWFAPLPFIGGDFLPGVTLNDDIWMLGTSRSMARDFAQAAASPATGRQTGMRIEVDFQPFIAWGREMIAMNQDQADALAEDMPAELKSLTDRDEFEQLEQSLDAMRGISFRKWMENGKPRSSFHLHYQTAG